MSSKWQFDWVLARFLSYDKGNAKTVGYFMLCGQMLCIGPVLLLFKLSFAETSYLDMYLMKLWFLSVCSGMFIFACCSTCFDRNSLAMGRTECCGGLQFWRCTTIIETPSVGVIFQNSSVLICNDTRCWLQQFSLIVKLFRAHLAFGPSGRHIYCFFCFLLSLFSTFTYPVVGNKILVLELLLDFEQICVMEDINIVKFFILSLFLSV